MSLLEVTELSKEFGGLRALDGVSFRAERGEILGIIGPTRMGYAKIIPIVDYTARQVSRLLDID